MLNLQDKTKSDSDYTTSSVYDIDYYKVAREYANNETKKLFDTMQQNAPEGISYALETYDQATLGYGNLKIVQIVTDPEGKQTKTDLFLPY
jgi:hypothetical protein